MKNKKTTEVYFTQKDNRIIDAVLMSMIVLGIILVALWTFFYIGFGFFGLPMLIVGGAGIILLRSAKVTDEDFDSEVKRILAANNVEENDSTLKEFVIGKSEHIKKGNDKKIRTAYYCVTVFDFGKEICKAKKYVLDIFGEAVTETEYSIPLGSRCGIEEITCRTALGETKCHYLKVEELPEVSVPVNVNIYDTEDVINRLKHKR